ncbi:MAG: MarR family winged helix-turn-helix transcriptional regulator [Candidatus Limnocylindria bacterium]
MLSTQAVAEIPPAVRAWTRLLRAHAATTRLLSAELQAEHGLTINDYEALYLLGRAEGRRMKRVDLSRRLLLTPSGVTRLLEGLEQAGLVERVACPTDLRVSYAQLTDAGAAKLDAASCGHVASLRALFAEHFSDDEIEKVSELLGRLPGVAEGDDACAAA